MSTRTRFEEEAKGNSEMAYYILYTQFIGISLQIWVIYICHRKKPKFSQCRVYRLEGLREFSWAECQTIWKTSKLVEFSTRWELQIFLLIWLRNGNRIISGFKINWTHVASWCHNFESCVDSIHFKMVISNILIQWFAIENHTMRVIFLGAQKYSRNKFITLMHRFGNDPFAQKVWDFSIDNTSFFFTSAWLKRGVNLNRSFIEFNVLPGHSL